jgi:hypothetical protein
VKKKINTDIKAAVMLIIAENIIALRNVIRTIITSISKSVGVNRRSILLSNKRKHNTAKCRKILKRLGLGDFG